MLSIAWSRLFQDGSFHSFICHCEKQVRPCATGPSAAQAHGLARALVRLAFYSVDLNLYFIVYCVLQRCGARPRVQTGGDAWMVSHLRAHRAEEGNRFPLRPGALFLLHDLPNIVSTTFWGVVVWLRWRRHHSNTQHRRDAGCSLPYIGNLPAVAASSSLCRALKFAVHGHACQQPPRRCTYCSTSAGRNFEVFAPCGPI